MIYAYEWPSWVDPLPFPFPELHNIEWEVYVDGDSVNNEPL